MRISRDLTHPWARRFSIAHELGHVVLRHPPHDHAHATPSRGPLARRAPDIEIEANAFAAELLMPTSLVRARCEVSPLDLAIAHGIAQDFRVTVVAAARRVVELTSERATMVYAERGAIRWARSSPALPWELTRGQRLHPASVAADYFRAGMLDERAQAIPVGAWFPEDRAGDAELVEHSLVLADPPAVLSLLWIPEAAAARLRFDETSQSMEQDVVADLIDLLRGVYQ
ncbi:MAG: ImmA/IrrE family metallo-endopeptidase [Deltaproteobacteria bacterium]|nr:ImmA/IrrE family metallo-endopeptidase [Deltaproteobacteria bacterium]